MEGTTVVNLEQVEHEVRRILASGDTERLRQLLAIQHPADVADIIDRLDAGEQCRVFELFTVKQAADVLHELSTETTRQLLDCLSVAEIGDVLNEMPHCAKTPITD